jgi:hypothetical protein
MIRVTEHHRIYGTIHHPPMDNLEQVAEFHEIELSPDDIEEFKTEGYAHIRVNDYMSLTLEEVCTSS